jgi:uncharacterized membrane-anchored protein YitT (DUF2179 family)
MRKVKVIDLLAIAAGTAIMGFGINAFNIANHLAEGGVTGASILLKLALDWDPGLVSLIVNLPLLLLGWRVLGLRSLAYTIWGTGCLSLSLWLCGRFRYPLDDLLLAALAAGVAVGAGLGIVFRFGGTTGGVDIIARIFEKKLGFKVGRTMFVADVAVIGVSLVYLSLPQAMYTVVAVFVGTRIIDLVQEAAYSARAMTVISEKPDAVAHRIMEELGRGVTMLKGRGAYTGAEKIVLYAVVGRSELARAKRIVLAADPTAFISIGVASEVLGEGFTLDSEKRPISP